MRRGKHWPIPERELLDGASLALKNADRLCKDARMAFNNDRFSTAMALSVLALEEYGKCLLLYEAKTKQRMITEDIWHKEFENHEAKLDAILRVLSSFPLPPKLKEQGDKDLLHFKKLFQKWRNRKLESIYLDWDAATGMWYNYDDRPDTEKKNDAKEVLELTEDWFKRFTENMGDLAFATRKEKIEALRSGKAHCFCDSCGLIMWNEKEFLSHRRIFPNHAIQWYKNT